MADKIIGMPGESTIPVLLKDTSGGAGTSFALASVPVDASGTVTAGASPASGSPVALASPPAATNAGSATALHFAADVNHLYLINQSAVTVGVEWDGGTATVGSYQLPAGQPLVLDVHIVAATGISIYTASAININGSTGSNLVVKGTS